MSNPNYTDGDPNYTIPNPRLNPSNANILKKKGITDLFPFRIVTFSSMKAAGRILSRGYQMTDHQKALLFHHIITYASDKWLAVGDIVSSFDNNVNEFNVLLVFLFSSYTT